MNLDKYRKLAKPPASPYTYVTEREAFLADAVRKLCAHIEALEKDLARSALNMGYFPDDDDNSEIK